MNKEIEERRDRAAFAMKEIIRGELNGQEVAQVLWDVYEGEVDFLIEALQRKKK